MPFVEPPVAAIAGHRVQERAPVEERAAPSARRGERDRERAGALGGRALRLGRRRPG